MESATNNTINGTGFRVPQMEELRDETVEEMVISAMTRLAEKLEIDKAKEAVVKMTEKELKKVADKKSVRQRLVEMLAREEELKKEWAQLQAEEERERAAGMKRKQAAEAKLVDSQKKVTAYQSVIDKYTKKRDEEQKKLKRDKVIKDIIMKFLEDQAMEYVVNEETNQVTGIKFWKIHPKRPNSECVIYMKKFDPMNLSEFEVDKITPMFPEFEEIKTKAMQMKNLVLLITECVKHWKLMYTSASQ